MEKLLTIVIPSYNMEKYLPKCLESVLVEDRGLLDLLDVIVVNDGSKDGTSAIGHRYATLYPNSVRVVDKENGHHGSCVNCGLKMARGRFIRILDADDYFDKAAFNRYLIKLFHICSKNSTIDAIITPYKRVSPDGVEISTTNYNLPRDKVFNSRNVFDVLRTVILPSVTYSTEMLHSINYHQTEKIAYSDTEWFFSPLAAIENCVYIAEAVYRYLIGRDGQTISSSERKKSLDDLETLLHNEMKLYVAIKNDRRFNETMLTYEMNKLMEAVFGTVVLYSPIGLTRRQIRKTLAVIRQCSPELESMAMSVSISRALGFSYVKFIETHPKLFLPYVVTMKFYLMIVHLIGKIKNAARKYGAMDEIDSKHSGRLEIS